jgi:hypothetical protein
MKLPFLSEKKTSGEVYCGVLLKEGQGVCYVYQKDSRSIHLLKQKEFQFTDGWEHIVDDVDEALSLIEQELGKQTIISQCIFFIFAHLLDQHTREIAKPYISKMRDISKLLELKPIGYMEVIDAVHEQLESEKQTALSSLVVEIDDTQMTIFLYKAGHKIVVQPVSRTDNFADDMQTALETIAQSHILPNHIYLYDSTDLAEESSDLLLHSWKKNLFIQQPRIVVVPASTVSSALLKLLEKQLCTTSTVAETRDDKQIPKEVMGFTIGEEVIETEETEELVSKKAFSFNLPKIALPSLRILPLVAIPFVLVLLAVGLIYLLHNATLIITVPVEKKQSEIEILASKKPLKADQVELQGFVSSFSFVEKKETTGKRDVGEKASGEITLYNYDEKEKQLAKGTKLQSNSLSYETDDATTIPASQFASDGITKNPGKNKVKIRAVILGTESNMEKNKRFSISDISSNIVFGINEAAIGGGTKKAVRTISKTDMDNLRQLVLDKAKKAALEKQKTDKTYFILPELTVAQANKEKFSGEIGEEATSLSYTSSGEVSLFRIPQKTIGLFVQKKLESEKPSGFVTDKVAFNVKKQKKLENGDIQLTLGGEIVFSKALDTGVIIKTLVGKSSEEGQSILRSQFGISEVDIAINPPLPVIGERMPFWQDHIRVELLR